MTHRDSDNKSRTLIIMRGVSGSGKSTQTRKILLEEFGIAEADLHKHTFSTDDYFVRKDTGVYDFKPERIGRAHEWNQNRVAKAMQERSVHPIVVDNTNTMFWEMKPYVQLAVDHGYKVEFREPETEWKRNAEELARRNVHNVPLEAIQRMLDRWEEDPTVEKVLKAVVPRRNRPRRGRGGGGGGRGGSRGGGSGGRGRGGSTS